MFNERELSYNEYVRISIIVKAIFIMIIDPLCEKQPYSSLE